MHYVLRILVIIVCIQTQCNGAYSIRPAQQNDYDSLIAIVKETLTQNYANFETQEYVQLQLAKPESWFSFYLDDENYFLGVACDENNFIAGFIGAWRLRERYIYISPVMIHPEIQRKGIGALLINDLFERFPWCDLLFLKVNARNTQAHAFYIKMGFIDLGYSIDSSITHTAEHTIMAKPRTPMLSLDTMLIKNMPLINNSLFYSPLPINVFS